MFRVPYASGDFIIGSLRGLRALAVWFLEAQGMCL